MLGTVLAPLGLGAVVAYFWFPHLWLLLPGIAALAYGVVLLDRVGRRISS